MLRHFVPFYPIERQVARCTSQHERATLHIAHISIELSVTSAPVVFRVHGKNAQLHFRPTIPLRTCLIFEIHVESISIYFGIL